MEELRIRNIRLEEEVRRMKEMSSPNFKESRVLLEAQNLRASSVSNSNSGDVLKLKK